MNILLVFSRFFAATAQNSETLLNRIGLLCALIMYVV